MFPVFPAVYASKNIPHEGHEENVITMSLMTADIEMKTD